MQEKLENVYEKKVTITTTTKKSWQMAVNGETHNARGRSQTTLTRRGG